MSAVLSGFNLKSFRSLEFLLTVLSNLAAWLLVLNDSLPTTWGVYVTAASAALYAIARGVGKENTDVKNYWHTTEFWISVISSVPAVWAALAGTIDPKTYVVVQGIIVALTKVANGMRKNPALAAGMITAAEAEAQAKKAA